jgi:hypothetical protein
MGVTSRRVGIALACLVAVGVTVAVVWNNRGGGGDRHGPDGSAQAPQLTGPMEVSPGRLRKGDPFTVTLTDGRVVGSDFSLAVWDGSGWTYQYQLFGSDDPFEDGDQPWRTWRERTDLVPDLALGGPAPIHLVVPSKVISGDFRLCVETTEPPVCSGLVVVD